MKLLALFLFSFLDCTQVLSFLNHQPYRHKLRVALASTEQHDWLEYLIPQASTKYQAKLFSPLLRTNLSIVCCYISQSATLRSDQDKIPCSLRRLEPPAKLTRTVNQRSQSLTSVIGSF
ncbi:hypothetical protein Pst134EB_031037 [Puccinia striiformis f. sp. tritici]|nr:hypothetical protein Pst134EB_031037 [Puccinia striiformis f. sp. tritici]